jgi:hypothetical protein
MSEQERRDDEEERNKREPCGAKRNRRSSKVDHEPFIHFLPAPSRFAECELNYLHEANPGRPDPANEDLRIFAGLAVLKSELRDPIGPEVSAQYDESFALFNRMRARLGRSEILAPLFDGAGNPLDPLFEPAARRSCGIALTPPHSTAASTAGCAPAIRTILNNH